MDIRQLEIFMFVAQEKSFSQAAQCLNLSQPTVSAHIAALEKELSHKLFERHYNEAKLTETGKQLYPYAKKILALREEALFYCTNHNENVRIVASTIPYQYVVPIFCSEFKVQYPDVQFDMTVTNSEQAIQCVLKKQADIGFVGSIIPCESLNYQAIMEEDLVLIVPQTAPYDSMVTQPIHLKDLELYPFIRRKDGSGTWSQTLALMRSYDITLHVISEFDSPDKVIDAVSEGKGISVVSQLFAQDYQRFAKINMLTLQDHPIKRKLYSVTHKNHRGPYLSTQFINFIKRKQITKSL